MASGPSLGDMYIDLHTNTDPFNRELAALSKIDSETENSLDKVGTEFGDTVADSMSDELGRHGKDFGRAIEDSVKNETIRVRSKSDYHTVRDSRGRFAKRITDEITEALSVGAGPRGPFSKLG
jgi:hypothetical protein